MFYLHIVDHFTMFGSLAKRDCMLLGFYLCSYE